VTAFANAAQCDYVGPMIESFKKTVLAGLGAAVVTGDRVQERLEEFVKQGKITAAEARAMGEKIAAEGRQEFDKASAKVGDKVRELLAYADGKHLGRIEALEARIAALERKPRKGAKRSAAK
jgi:polyhydroxyalkanoate synthesis regulator phasin